jgi:hypothetical protein
VTTLDSPVLHEDTFVDFKIETESECQHMTTYRPGVSNFHVYAGHMLHSEVLRGPHMYIGEFSEMESDRILSAAGESFNKVFF